MRVMHVIDSLAPGGMERMLVEIVNHSPAYGIRPSVCVTRQDRTLATELVPGVPVYVLCRRWALDLQGLRLFAQYARQEKAELFHVHGRSSFSFAAFAAQLGLVSAPIVLHDHYGVELDSSIPTWLRLWGRRHIAHYVGVYDRLAGWARRAGVPEERITVLGNGLDLSRIEEATPLDVHAEFGIPHRVPVGLIVGNIRPEKGTLDLLEAIGQNANGLEAVFVVVGSAADPVYMRECQRRTASGLTGRVVFAGARDDVPRLLKGASFAVLPSRSESGPLVLIEYMAAGLPFVATRVGDIGHRVAGSGLPEFVPPGDPAALRGAIERLLALSPSERQRRGSLGRDLARRLFGIQRWMPHWSDLYRGLLPKAVR